jgi:Na+-translocating ferredoxin:NAD+ oxidoreductase RnfG subunit
VKPFILAVALLGAALPLPARAAATYFTTQQVLREFFPKSEKVSYRKLKLAPAEVALLQERLGYRPARLEYVVFVATTGEHVDGYAIIDDEKGQHEQITFAVKLSPAGVVERHEVMVYRESYGEEITDPRFRKQFVGKTAKDPVRAGQDIDVVTGATISSRSMTLGVRRALVLVEELVLKKDRALTGTPSVASGVKG